MMNWAPVSCSKSESLRLSRSASVPPRMPTRSVTHCVGGDGTSSAPREKDARRAQMNSALLMSTGRCRSRVAEVGERHLGRLAAAGRTAEVRLLLEAAHARHQAGRKAAHRGVVCLRGLVVAPALDGDAVLRPFELRLQLEEVLVRLQLGIAL